MAQPVWPFPARPPGFGTPLRQRLLRLCVTSRKPLWPCEEAPPSVQPDPQQHPGAIGSACDRRGTVQGASSSFCEHPVPSASCLTCFLAACAGFCAADLTSDLAGRPGVGTPPGRAFSTCALSNRCVICTAGGHDATVGNLRLPDQGSQRRCTAHGRADSRGEQLQGGLAQDPRPHALSSKTSRRAYVPQPTAAGTKLLPSRVVGPTCFCAFCTGAFTSDFAGRPGVGMPFGSAFSTCAWPTHRLCCTPRGHDDVYVRSPLPLHSHWP